ncbi:IS3 family transposase [Pseudomonas syringae]|uniref:IS3 family transposase n=2 Tax=Pseudomonas syringae TaxID=317 RepID=A0AAT9SH77_PSESX|nr:IS3 family transposase [Pseudomonas syringae]UYS81431.1 IS3 family transposase [Pseudomonas syringae pv. actinidifoliorum ICMP 18803]
MTKKYRKFDAAFKLDVCKLIVDQGQSVNSVCLDMNLSDTAVRRWVEQYKAELLGGPGIGNPLTSEQQRIRQLEQQIRELKMDNDIPKKSYGLLCPRIEVIHQLVHQLQRKAYPVARICRVLRISRSGFYEAHQRRQNPRPACPAAAMIKATFESTEQCYGSRRLVSVLRNEGVSIGRFKVRRLMKQQGLRPIWKRKFVHTTNSNHNFPVAENLLNRQFNPEAINQSWVADITYIRTRSGWVYLAAVMDLFSRKIVGWAMAPHMRAELVTSAMQLAIAQRQPEPGLIAHSDRGSQYAGAAYQALLTRNGMRCSMSRKGNCWDNAVMERFFLNLKMERTWRKDYANHGEAIKDITDYIVRFYNERRLHSTLGYMPPNQYERQAA